MVEIHKFFGIPGSGKTERLLTEIEKFISDGAFLNDICYVTFSRSAANDAIKRIKDKFEIEDDPIYFGTIHSICKRLLGWNFNEEDGIQLEKSIDRHNFLKQFGLNYPITNDKEEPEIAFQENTTTDEVKLFHIINYCHHRFLPFDDWRESGIEFKDISPDDVIDIINQWDDYKINNNLVSFDDMLMESLEKNLYPATNILFIDEFQDLSPLLFEITQKWSENMKKVIVAGDDDQTIYTWAGASPDFILDLDAKETILDYSYRVPYVILQKARELIETVEKRRYKDFKENNKVGCFHHLSAPLFKDIILHLPNNHDKTVFFLFRTNNLAKIFVEEYLIPSGIPFTGIRQKGLLPNIWTYKLYEIRNAMVKIRKNEKLEKREVTRLLSIFPSCSKGRLDGIVRYGKKTWFKKKCKQDTWSVQELYDSIFTRIPSYDDRLVLSEIKNDMQKKAYSRNMESAYCTLYPYNIKVGTIHSSKGLESNTVFLFNNHSWITENEILEKGDDVIDSEKRLYYVGMTRSMEKLVFVDDFFNDYSFNLNI